KHGVAAPIDVHLMIRPVDRIVPDFAAAGATYITFHPEASEHVDRTIEIIREHGCKPGLVFNPATPLEYLDYTLEKLDLVLIMSVNPGFGGQKFIPTAPRTLLEAFRGQLRQADYGCDAWVVAPHGRPSWRHRESRLHVQPPCAKLPTDHPRRTALFGPSRTARASKQPVGWPPKAPQAPFGPLKT